MIKIFISWTTLTAIHQSTSNLIILIIGSYFSRHKMATPPGILPRTILVLKSVMDSPDPWKSLWTELSLSRSCLAKNVSWGRECLWSPVAGQQQHDALCPQHSVLGASLMSYMTSFWPPSLWIALGIMYPSPHYRHMAHHWHWPHCRLGFACLFESPHKSTFRPQALCSTVQARGRTLHLLAWVFLAGLTLHAILGLLTGLGNGLSLRHSRLVCLGNRPSLQIYSGCSIAPRRWFMSAVIIRRSLQVFVCRDTACFMVVISSPSCSILPNKQETSRLLKVTDGSSSRWWKTNRGTVPKVGLAYIANPPLCAFSGWDILIWDHISCGDLVLPITLSRKPPQPPNWPGL